VSLRSFFRLFTHIQMLPVLESGEETLVGGQAVIEGVMMRAPHSYCVAVRKPTGEVLILGAVADENVITDRGNAVRVTRQRTNSSFFQAE